MSFYNRQLWNEGNSIQSNMISIRYFCKFSIIFKPMQFSSRQSKILPKVATQDNVIHVTEPAASHESGDPNMNFQSKKSEMGLNDSSLESTWAHRAWVAIGCGAMVAVMAKSIIAIDSSESIPLGLISAYIGYVLADLATGIYHWGVDNYGDADTPIFGPQIDGFQGHHKRPWTITKRQFANNIHALARPASFILGAFVLLPGNTAVDAFVGVMTSCVVFSQQFHCWAHSKKRQLPELVVGLQEKGILVSRLNHAAHHRAPYDNNYCIVSGMWNPVLDNSKFFKKLEVFIHSRWGVRPRCWDETSTEWLQDGSYFED